MAYLGQAPELHIRYAADLRDFQFIYLNISEGNFMISKILFCTALLFTSFMSYAAILTNPGISEDAIGHWVTSVVDFSPGPQDINVPGSPIVTHGLPSAGLGARDNSTVSLGDGGSITLAFDTPISNIAGPDFAIFENGFSFGGKLFAELGFVAVSSDGTNFASFATSFINPEIDDSFGSAFRLIDVNQINNFAGAHAAPLGTGFELSDLAGDSLIIDGLVDLNAIMFIRITDAIGDGSRTDTLGNPILDPYPTDVGVGGFDLDAIGAIAPVPIPPAVALFGSAILWLFRNRRPS